MSSKARSRGYRAERDLVRMLWRLGFAVIRAPASGSRVKYVDYPDVIAIYKGKVLTFEVKRRSELSHIYIGKKQLEKLISFTERAGGKAYIAVKIPGREWVFVDIDKAELISNDKYRISKEAIENGKKLHEVLEELGIGLLRFMSSNE